MLAKDLRRGERRWRSYSTWMRRLKADWATHGRQYNIYPIYEWVNGKQAGLIGWRNTLCGCFDLTSREAYRFKDTPHRMCYAYECNQRKANHGRERLPIQERRAVARAMGDDMRAALGTRRREPERLILIRKTCFCGYLFSKEWLPAGVIRWSDRRGSKRCPDCQRKYEEAIKKRPA
jgi:hypothetical protein